MHASGVTGHAAADAYKAATVYSDVDFVASTPDDGMTG